MYIVQVHTNSSFEPPSDLHVAWVFFWSLNVSLVRFVCLALFKHDGDSLPAPDAGGSDSVLLVVLPQFVDQVGGNSGARSRSGH